jgi:hypothetical protein
MDMVEFCNQSSNEDGFSMLKKFFETNFLISNVIVPLALLALYCGSFAYISSQYLPEGVNFFFASRLGKYAALATVVMCLVLFISLKSKMSGEMALKRSSDKFHPADLLLLLLPLTPVAQYVLNNQDILLPTESLYVLAIFALFSSLYIFAVPALINFIVPARTSMIMGLAFAFSIVNMALLSDYFNWFEQGTLKKQMLFFGGVFLITWLLYNLNQKKMLYLLIAVNFVTNSSVQFFAQSAKVESPSAPVEQNKLLALVGDRTPAITPNIYLLVYDAYVPNETMLGYGIDNSSQEEYLSGQGFTLYPHTYSIGSGTLKTMSRVLNASTEYYGDHRRAVSGDGVVQNKLKDFGYRTYGLFYSDFMFRGYGESYDYSLPASSIPPYTHISEAILVGEFRFDIGDTDFNGQTREQFVADKQRMLENASRDNSFVYMHSNLPSHSQNSGKCLPNEVDLYKERLAAANVEMRHDVEIVLANDPGAIVIIAGDHGPALTKNCRETSGVYDISEITRLDIQDRYGTFLAIHWPAEGFEKYDDIVVLQDLFPTIFAYMYQDASILDSRVTSPIPSNDNSISGASVEGGVIEGGVNDGEPLFLSGR